MWPAPTGGAHCTIAPQWVRGGWKRMLQDLHIGAPVLARDGRTLGELARVVVDPGHQVTHLVVDPGLVESGNLLEAGGGEKARGRVRPVELVERAGPAHNQLSCDEAQLRAPPPFERPP